MKTNKGKTFLYSNKTMTLMRMYLRPMMGMVLQILHLAWCRAFSAAASRCMTGTQTRDWGSWRNQSRNWVTVISPLPPAYKQPSWLNVEILRFFF